MMTKFFTEYFVNPRKYATQTYNALKIWAMAIIVGQSLTGTLHPVVVVLTTLLLLESLVLTISKKTVSNGKSCLKISVRSRGSKVRRKKRSGKESRHKKPCRHDTDPFPRSHRPSHHSPQYDQEQVEFLWDILSARSGTLPQPPPLVGNDATVFSGFIVKNLDKTSLFSWEKMAISCHDLLFVCLYGFSNWIVRNWILVMNALILACTCSLIGFCLVTLRRLWVRCFTAYNRVENAMTSIAQLDTRGVTSRMAQAEDILTAIFAIDWQDKTRALLGLKLILTRCGYNLNITELAVSMATDLFQGDILDYVIGRRGMRGQDFSFSDLDELHSVLTGSKLATKFWKFVNLLVAAKLVPEINLQTSGISFFSLRAAERTVKFADLKSAFLDLYMCFKAGYSSYLHTGSWSTFFEFEDLERDILRVLSYTRYVATDTFEKECNTKYGDLMDEITSLMSRVEDRMKAVSYEKSGLRTYLHKLQALKNDVSDLMKGQNMQMQAFALCFYGDSGVGKSFFANSFLQWMLRCNGFKAEPRHMVVYNTLDKYDSNWTSGVTGVIFDDLANSAPDPNRRVSDLIIRMINPVTQRAVMPDVESKGKVLVSPNICIATTNNPDLHAKIESTCPSSILRRFKYYIKFEVKPEFCLPGSTSLDGDKVREKYAGMMYPPVWNFRIYEVVSMDHGGYQKRPILNHWAENDDTEVFEMNHLTRFCRLASASHFVNERASLATRQKSLQVETEVNELPREACLEGNSAIALPAGALNNYNPGAFEDFLRLRMSDEQRNILSYCKSSEKYFDRYDPTVQPERRRPFRRQLRGQEGEEDAAVEVGSLELPSKSHEDMTWIDACYERFAGGVTVVFDVATDRVCKPFTRYCSQTYGRTLELCSSTALYFTIAYGTGMLCPLAFVPTVTFGYLFHRSMSRMKKIRKLVAEQGTVARELYNRSGDLRAIGAFMVVLGLCFGLYRYLYTQMRGNTKEQSVSEWISRWLNRQNPWSTDRSARVHGGEVARTSTPSDLIRRVSKNVVHVKHGDRVCNGLFLRDGVLLLPKHFVLPIRERVDLDLVYISKNNREVVRTVPLDPTVVDGQCDLISVDEDVVAVRVNGACPKRDIIDCFVERTNKQSTFKGCMYGYNPQGEWVKAPVGRYRYDIVSYTTRGKKSSYMGWLTDMEQVFDTDGMCMAPVYRDEKSPCICGLHIAGSGIQSFAIAIDQEKALEYIKILERSCGMTCSDSTEAMELAGNMADQGTHRWCATRKFDPKCPVEVLGTVSGTGPRRMSTRLTPFSINVMKHFGLPNSFGVPPGAATRVGDEIRSPWINGVHEMNRVRNGLTPSHLRKATKEIVNKFACFVGPYSEQCRTAPLSYHEAINGVPGHKGLEGQKMNTSAGHRFPGKKVKHLKVTEYPYEYNDDIMREIAENDENLRNGKWVLNVLNGSLKDEPISKEKCDSFRTRIFYSDEVTMLTLVGKYYGPVLAYLTCFPHNSHSAIGINAHSYEWDAMYQHLDHGKRKGLCLDFKAFDKTLPQNLVRWSWQVLIEIAKKMPGYDADDIRAMETIADQKTMPIIAFNGTLVRLGFSHTSGNMCTAAVGSIAGLMLLVYSWYELVGEDTDVLEKLRSMHLGDDLVATVPEEYSRRYNFISVQKVLSQAGITITMPDKSSTPTAVQDIWREDFLKRVPRYCPIRDSVVGVLAVKSVFKSLLYYLPSQVALPADQLGQTLEAACLEYSLRTEDEYNHFRDFAIGVRDAYGLNAPALDLTYDERCIRWMETNFRTHPAYALRLGLPLDLSMSDLRSQLESLVARRIVQQE